MRKKKKKWEEIKYTVFPTRYSWILLGVLVVGSLCLFKFYNEESGQTQGAPASIEVYYKEGRQMQGSSATIEVGYKEDKQMQESSVLIGLYSEFWAIAIAVMVFLFEISRNYLYGLTLKRIINFSTGLVMTAIAGIYFVLLCPLAYQCESTYRYKTLLAIIVFSFVLFGMAIMFLAGISRRIHIRKLIEKRSRQQILQIRELFFSDSIPRLNDSLLLREVIEHTDYSNIREWENMIVAISGCMADKDVISCLTGTLAEHTILKAMTKHIIYKSGLETEYVFIRTVDILDRLLENLIHRLEDDFCEQANNSASERKKEKKIISFILQVLLTLLDYNSHSSIKAFLDLWQRNKRYQMDITSYIYLYVNYESLSGNGMKESCWQTICENKDWKYCQEHRNYWDIDHVLALELWMDWEQYNGNGVVRGLNEFHDLMNRLESVQANPNEDINIIIPEYLQRGMRNED
mgnify:FL=1